MLPHLDLADALSRDDIASADVAVRRLVNKAKDESAKLRMIRDGVAATLISLLKHERANPQMRRNATAAIAELALLDTCETQLVAVGTVQILVWLINPSNNDDRIILASACRALRNLLGGTEHTAEQAVKYGCIEPLLRLINGRRGHPEEPDIVPEAVAALANLSHHGYRFQSYVIKHSALDALNNVGSRTVNEMALFHIVNVLAEFARTERWQSAIVAAGGVGTGMRALKIARDAEVLAEAARLIGNLAVANKGRVAIREAGGVSILLDRLARMSSYKDSVPALDICIAISNLCFDPKAATEALANNNASVVLLKVISDQTASDILVEKVSHALCVLARGSSTRRARVLNAIANQIRQDDDGGRSNRLHDLRQMILETTEGDNHSRQSAIPETLESLALKPYS